MVMQTDGEAIVFPDGYTSYSSPRLKEDDLVIRKHLLATLGVLRRELIATMERGQGSGSAPVSEAARRAVDEVDLLAADLQSSELGATFPWFSAQRNATSERLVAVIKFDASLLDRILRASETIRLLREPLGAAGSNQFVFMLENVQAHLRDSRGIYRERLLHLKGLAS